jgi:beta-N-acetylhexosaminidase
MGLTLPLSVLCGQVIVSGFDGPELSAPLATALRKGERGGVILFKRNLPSLAHAVRTNSLVAALAPPDLPPFIGVDEEGGRVRRLPEPALKLPPMARLAATGDEGLLEEVGATLGEELQHVGFTLDFAPVLDVDTNPANPIIGDRSFGKDPETATRLALAFHRGLARHVLGCGKHYPGHGDTDLDSHLALPVLHHDDARLRSVELPPFQAAALAGMASLMSAHVVVDAWDRGVPATLSKRICTDILRGELGYRGVLFSDDLLMKAVADLHPIEELAVGAITAGCDALLVCNDDALSAQAHEALVREAEKSEAFRARLDEAVTRGLEARRARPPAPNAQALDDLLASEKMAALRTRIDEAVGTSTV